MTTKVLSVTGVTQLEIPGGASVPCEFTVLNGSIKLSFNNDVLADFIVGEVVNNRLIALGLHYVAARDGSGQVRQT